MNDESQPASLLKKFTVGENVKTTVRRAILLALFCLLLFNYVLLPVRVRGISMEPTFHDGSWHVANLLQFATRGPRRGEVVVISMVGGRRTLYLKRVLGLPGETIHFFNGQMIVNGREETEPYLGDRGKWTLPQVTLAADEYFVAGDNRTAPLETHTLGVVKRKKIAGGVFR
ncbi:MAG TPA: signal peptidase I [Kiritimatiellia bacterium]|nr:signal peptidase I [Kiritimatiellia bacterium]HRZ13264.1 signal peptidase I [Kiritimatiellia bacterium]HSA18713.1 signal peptidase I [Kiritimatiellia bacterium]